ncbi:MAG: peptidoglycan-binding protein [Lachnospiraceae bacterium]|nr:peptidoglycan-binding protein [Lachnospiraceae bacterium]
MIKTYKSTDNVRLSENFCSKEFYCKCGKNHEQYISDELVSKLQSLIEILGADKAIINSGYRCASHDKFVGGSGYGMHTKGLAADVKFYKGNTVLSTKTVACKAQDIGFTGIANIDSSYTAIHLDVRTGSKWYGDEALGEYGTNNTITSDFYSYYKIARPQNDSIIELQRILNKKGAGLDEDGIAGAKTLAEVRKYTIDEGDTGELVKWVQARLKSLGYSVGSVDGIAGTNTMSAIAEFQSANKLGIGYLGGGDWNVLLRD